MPVAIDATMPVAIARTYKEAIAVLEALHMYLRHHHIFRSQSQMVSYRYENRIDLLSLN
jgi:hypothetical protein